ncbi:hypothetical protein ACFPAG_00150 [Vogesella sp. GCM10023246]|uniref:Uncharacterized protein n=1 Tax=Vogesella oryzagri TaxID=3160864 RepID=A0ABV1LYW3_9NEIS
MFGSNKLMSIMPRALAAKMQNLAILLRNHAYFFAFVPPCWRGGGGLRSRRRAVGSKIQAA